MSVRYKAVKTANLLFRWSIATKAAGLDNAGSKWSREAQTKFVPRGLRQGSIINASQKNSNLSCWSGAKHLKKRKEEISPFGSK